MQVPSPLFFSENVLSPVFYEMSETFQATTPDEQSATSTSPTNVTPLTTATLSPNTTSNLITTTTNNIDLLHYKYPHNKSEKIRQAPSPSTTSKPKLSGNCLSSQLFGTPTSTSATNHATTAATTSPLQYTSSLPFLPPTITHTTNCTISSTTLSFNSILQPTANPQHLACLPQPLQQNSIATGDIFNQETDIQRQLIENLKKQLIETLKIQLIEILMQQQLILNQQQLIEALEPQLIAQPIPSPINPQPTDQPLNTTSNFLSPLPTISQTFFNAIGPQYQPQQTEQDNITASTSTFSSIDNNNIHESSNIDSTTSSNTGSSNISISPSHDDEMDRKFSW